MSRMIGTACQPTRSRWWTVEVNRNSRGRAMHAKRGDPDRAQHVGEQQQVAAEAGAGLADSGQRADNSVLLGGAALPARG